MVTPHSHYRGIAVLGAALAAAALLASGCSSSAKKTTPSGSGATTTSTPTETADPALAAMLPAKIKSAGKMVVAADASYAPNEFLDTDGKTVVGMDADLAKALAAKMGLTASVVNVKFDNIIPGLQGGTYDLGMSSFTDTKKRENTVDFVTYFSAGTSLMVKSGNPDNLKPDDDSLCGKKVAVEKGTVQEDPDVPDRSKKCQADGKPAITRESFDDQSGANLALASGRADAVLADSPVAAYAAKQSNGQFEISGSTYDTAPYGIAVPKTDGQFKDAVLGALKDLMTDGTYKNILSKWGITAGAIDNPGINQATS